MATDPQIRTWLVILKKMRAIDQRTQADDELDKLIKDLEDSLGEKKESPGRLLLMGKKVSKVILKILIRYSEHELIKEMIEWFV